MTLKTASTHVSPTAQQGEPDDGLKGYSCLTCRQRKVKCDRRAPCSNCVKTEKQCSFVPPTRGKRKRTKLPKEGLHAKLKRYEELLKSYGARIEPLQDEEDSDLEMVSQPETVSQVDIEMDEDTEFCAYRKNDPFGLLQSQPKLVARGGTCRYFDSSLWTSVGDHFRHPEVDAPGEVIDEPSVHVSGMILGTTGSSALDDLASLHPPSQLLPRLKEVYVDRVDPLMKVLHLPTFWNTLTDALQTPQDMPKSLQALAFAFYLSVFRTLVDGECEDLFGETQQVLYSRFSRATCQALLNAGFLSTCNIMTLQAYSIYITMCERETQRCDTLFTLSGIAIRLARKMGLHRDGTYLGLSPFETEMRRRMWWHLIHADFRLADVLGTKPSSDLACMDTRIPLNVDDEELYPQMTELPPDRDGITSITIYYIRCRIMEVIRNLPTSCPGDMSWEVFYSRDIPLSKKDQVINELQNEFENKFLRYCDPSNSLHVFVSVNIRAAVCKMKLIAHNPRQFAENHIKVPIEERNIVYENAMKLLDYVTLMQANRDLQKYMWQMGGSYLWNTILYLLIEARTRKTGLEVDKAWKMIGKIFSNGPRISEKSAGGMQTVMGKWTVDVWDDYVATMKSQGCPEPSTPDYINAFRRLYTPQAKPRPRNKDSSMDCQPMPQYSLAYNGTKNQTYDENFVNFENYQDFDFPNLPSFEMDPAEWIQWEQSLSGPSGFPHMGIKQWC